MSALPFCTRRPGNHGYVLAGITKKMAALIVFVRRFLVQKSNSYEDLVVEITNHYPNLRSCSLRSVKRYCSYNGIKKRMTVPDETLDIAVQGAISEVRLCSKSKMNVVVLKYFHFVVESI